MHLSNIYLRLLWNSGESGGWHIEICGRNESIDMSSFSFERKETGPFHTVETGFWSSPKTIGTGPKIWLLTPDQEPILGQRDGALCVKPPMPQVTQYLEALEEQGYKVVASHSMSFEEHPSVVSVWTLNQA